MKTATNPGPTVGEWYLNSDGTLSGKIPAQPTNRMVTLTEAHLVGCRVQNARDFPVPLPSINGGVTLQPGEVIVVENVTSLAAFQLDVATAYNSRPKPIRALDA